MRAFSPTDEPVQNRRKRKKDAEVCELCGETLEADNESGERVCPICDNPEE